MPGRKSVQAQTEAVRRPASESAEIRVLWAVLAVPAGGAPRSARMVRGAALAIRAAHTIRTSLGIVSPFCNRTFHAIPPTVIAAARLRHSAAEKLRMEALKWHIIDFFQALAAGLLVGGTYGLMCVGLGIIFGVMRVVNFAQGDFMMLGMYVAYYLVTGFGILAFLGPYAGPVVGAVAGRPGGVRHRLAAAPLL